MKRRWLQEKFAEFYIEVERQKVAVRSGRWAYYPENPVPFDPRNPGTRGPNPVWEALANLLRQQAEESGQSGASGLNLYREAQYAMAALADEIFIAHLPDWPGRNDWNTYPLELAFFNTRAAGQNMFHKMSQLLARRDPGERHLAEIYFNVLALGFKGQFFVPKQAAAPGGRGHPQIDELRRRLYHCFTEGGGGAANWVSEQPYKYIENREMGGRIPSILQSVVFLGIAVGFLFLANLVFQEIVKGGVYDNLEAINKTLSSRVLK